MRAREEGRRAPRVFRLAVIVTLLLAPAAGATSIDTRPRPTLVLPASGQFVARDSWEGVALYRLKDASLVRRFRAGYRVNKFAVTRDEKTLLIACYDGNLAAFDVATGASCWSLSPRQSGLRGGWDVSFSADGQSVVVCGMDELAIVLETRTGRQLGAVRFPPRQMSIMSAALSPDGSHGVLLTLGGTLFAFDVATGRLQDTGVTGAWPVCYSVDGKYIALRSNNSGASEQLRIVTADGNWSVRDLGQFDEIGHIKPLEDGGFLASALAGSREEVSVGVVCWPDRGKLEELWRFRQRGRERMDFTPDGKVGVSTTAWLETALLDLRTKTVLASVDNSAQYAPGPVTSVLMLLGLRETAGWIVLLVTIPASIVVARAWRARRRQARAARASQLAEITRRFGPVGTEKQSGDVAGDNPRICPSPP